MDYISTRNNYSALSSAGAIAAGMVPSGGLFVPQYVPILSMREFVGKSYAQTAGVVLTSLLTDFTNEEIRLSVDNAYSDAAFDTKDIICLPKIGDSRYVMELWHGPTAAFKDMALQIMPYFMKYSKEKCNDSSHTLILVATSGDTGKAALEGFKNRDGISIVVFYPHEGVSDIQKLQMQTTEGDNTYVVAVKGNFDDCQAQVKKLFADSELSDALGDKGIKLSSANSINWGRLCPQIVYYIKAYCMLVDGGEISFGEKVDFCVPTGNFGNILAGYYAINMGLPVRKLICASNRNNVLSDFFNTGIYDRNREFFKTMSPSMDILISSNLERFLFEMTGHDAHKINRWFCSLSGTGSFQIDGETSQRISSVIDAGWVDEQRVLDSIAGHFNSSGYLMDTHTAVAAAVCETLSDQHTPVIIASTASPYKFSGDVLKGIGVMEEDDDEFKAVEKLYQLSSVPVHRAVEGLREKVVKQDRVIGAAEMKDVIENIAERIEA